MSTLRHKRTARVAIVLLALALLLLWLWPRPGARSARSEKARRVPSYQPATPGPAPLLTGTVDEAIPERARYPVFVQGKPLLDEVTVEPARICAGHTFTISIKAHDPEGEDDRGVIVGVNSSRGSPWAGELATPGPRQVLIQAFDLDGNYEQKGVTINVEACPELGPPLRVWANGQALGVYALVAQLPAGSEDQGPFTFSWDTGDGHTYETTSGYLEHDYLDRKVDTLFSGYLIRVVARGKDGLELPGVTGVQMMNPYYANRQIKGLVVPDVHVVDARIVGDRAVVHAVVRQHEGEVIEAYPSEVRTVGCGKDDPHQVELGQVQASTSKFADGVTPLEIAVPLAALGEGCGLAYVLSGTSGKERLPIHIDFGAMFRQPPADDPLARRLPVDSDNPYAQAQIHRLELAAKALGRGMNQPISEDKLLELEARGTIPPLPATEPGH